MKRTKREQKGDFSCFTLAEDARSFPDLMNLLATVFRRLLLSALGRAGIVKPPLGSVYLYQVAHTQSRQSGGSAV